MKKSCTLLYVHDGDSVSVKIGAVATHLRLNQIDAPELRQTWGKSAFKALVKLLKDQELAVECGALDKWGRTIGTLWVGKSNLTNVNLEMINSGSAWVYTRYVVDKAFPAAEATARNNKVGLWKAKRQTAPWIWRKRHNVGEIYNG